MMTKYYHLGRREVERYVKEQYRAIFELQFSSSIHLVFLCTKTLDLISFWEFAKMFALFSNSALSGTTLIQFFKAIMNFHSCGPF